MALLVAEFRPFRLTSTLALTCLGVLLAGCGRQAVTPVQVAEVDAPAEDEELPALEGESGPIVKRQSPRRVGDVWVHRFSGTYRKSALILREEVIADDGDVLLVEFALQEGDAETILRVEMAKRSERIIQVSKNVEGEFVPTEMTDFDALLAKTTFVPDQNHGSVASKDQTCLVGKDELNCELTEYKVSLGEQEATMTVARNGDMKRDISGEITAVDGTVLYHAELIEMQRGEESTSPSEGVAFVSENVALDDRE